MAPWPDQQMPGVLKAALVAAQLYAFFFACMSAYTIRLHAENEYGRIIHEFDPWFNFRATKYLWENGWTKFFHWYDHESWYPLGRPVGTTIYPGMQITSCVICKALELIGQPMSLNDVCVFVPAWFGVLATTFLALLTSEVAGFASAGVAAALVMSIIPAHIMRSVAGGYDNESVAITALCMTFFFWCRSLRNEQSAWIGVLTGLAYTYMVMVWGGYIFVLNLIGLHAGILWLTGCYSTKLHRAYTLFYVIGTFGATRVPVVGWMPLKSLEQLGAFGVFVILQVMEFCEMQRRRQNMTNKEVQSHTLSPHRHRKQNLSSPPHMLILPSLPVLLLAGQQAARHGFWGDRCGLQCHCPATPPHGLLRASVSASSWPVRAAHTNWQSARRFRRRAPACQPSGTPSLKPDLSLRKRALHDSCVMLVCAPTVLVTWHCGFSGLLAVPALHVLLRTCGVSLGCDPHHARSECPPGARCWAVVG